MFKPRSSRKTKALWHAWCSVVAVGSLSACGGTNLGPANVAALHTNEHLHGPGCQDPATLGPVHKVLRPVQSGAAARAAALFAHQSLPQPQGHCPARSTFDPMRLLCIKGANAQGPFPPAMVDRCKDLGGGPACMGTEWNADFASQIRGQNACPFGSATGPGPMCGSGPLVYGPFSFAEVTACEKAGGGAACQGMVWNRSFAESLVIPKDDPTKPLPGLVVSIDSGHGGDSLGFEVGVTSPFHPPRVLSDYLFNLATTSHVADWLRRRGARVHLFQYTQQTGPSIEDKGYRGRGSHVFLSVHHNGANRRAQGSEVFVHSSLASAPDRRLAFNIQDQLVARVWNGNGAFDRGVKAADFAILRGAAPVTGAAVLVEAFFIDTPESLVTFNSWMGPSARAIADGVSRYWITRTQF